MGPTEIVCVASPVDVLFDEEDVVESAVALVEVMVIWVVDCAFPRPTSEIDARANQRNCRLNSIFVGFER